MRKLSAKLRHIRWRRKKRKEKHHKKSLKSGRLSLVAPASMSFDARETLTFTEIQSEIKTLLDCNTMDIPKLKKLSKQSFSERRQMIKVMEDGAVGKIFDVFPLLKLPEFVSFFFFFYFLNKLYDNQIRLSSALRFSDLLFFG
jgi:hypothetical protein